MELTILLICENEINDIPQSIQNQNSEPSRTKIENRVFSKEHPERSSIKTSEQHKTTRGRRSSRNREPDGEEMAVPVICVRVQVYSIMRIIAPQCKPVVQSYQVANNHILTNAL
jgi:hypothetical protein